LPNTSTDDTNPSTYFHEHQTQPVKEPTTFSFDVLILWTST